MPKVKSKSRARDVDNEPSDKKGSSAAKVPFYAVRKGKKPGVYESWEECSEQTKDFPDSEYKSFSTKEDALEFVKNSNADNEESFCAYACGLSQIHGKKGAVAGVGVYFGPDHALNLSERIAGNQTINRAQIQAAVKAANLVKKSGKTPATVYTDSTYVINGITKWVKKWKTNGWKASSGEIVKNQEDFQELDEAVTGQDITWVHVSGGNIPTGSEEAKLLAKASLKLPLP